MTNKKKPFVLAVAGPTASGKTWLGAELAKMYGGEVVSADSMQIYKGMDIASAKPRVYRIILSDFSTGEFLSVRLIM